MNTDELIKALDADARTTAMPVGPAWWMAAGIAAAVAAIVFFSTLGPRPDFMQAAQTARFLFKFVFTLALAASAFALIRPLSMPGAAAGKVARGLLVAPLLILAAMALELVVVPEASWSTRLVGSNMMLCMAFIPLIGIGPLAVFLAALRHGAPTRPVLSGAVAGLLAGGTAATFYAAHCPDDSPLFVAAWYTVSIASLAALGALGARLFVRW